jgi:hypothetical protein
MGFSRTLEFFRVVGIRTTLETALANTYQSRIANFESNGILQLQDPAATIYLLKFDSSTDYCEGMLVKQRTQDVPKKGNYAQNLVEDFPLEPRTGFAEMTYFVYLPNLKVLALLAGKNAVKSGLFSRYVQEVSGFSDFELEIMLNKDAQQQLERWQNITRLQWKVKVGIGFSARSPLIRARSVHEMLEREEHPTVTLTQEFNNPKRSGSLPPLKIKERVKGLLRARNSDQNAELKSLVVKGSESADQEEALIDLLAYKFRLKVSLESGNALSYAECQQTVRSIVLDQQQNLRELVGAVR